MGLSKYQEKRQFNSSPEPSGKGSRKSKAKAQSLQFVVQKHHASHLHYDFRLELDGVLKSWAVPKGPSLNPQDKRLAMAVEDHPFDYKDFEGVIPEGNYGAGRVIVWDTGVYAVDPSLSAEENQKLIKAGLAKGDLKFVMLGQKLKGSFALVKMKREDNQWLLIKHRDEYASDDDIRQEAASVLSDRTLDDLAAEKKTNAKSHATHKKAILLKEKNVKKPVEKPNKSTTKKADKPKTEPVKKLGKFAKQAPSRNDAMTLEVNQHTVTITHPNKFYWKDAGYTKKDMVSYYQEMAPYILPYLKDRPYVMNRFPNGIETTGFYQKDQQPANLPEYVETIDIYSESNAETLQYLMCQNEETLLYLANLGCIEMNPWNSRQQNLDNPDWMVIDLDPEDIGFDKVIEAARVTHDILDDIGAANYCKTSGKTGLHIYVPLAAKYDYEIVRNFGQVIAELVNQELPETTSIERSPKKRQKRIYVDYLQNRYGQTLASPYSLRPTPSASASTPLHWDEVKKGLKPEKFTIKTLIKRVKTEGDLWKPVLKKGIDLKKCLKKLE